MAESLAGTTSLRDAMARYLALSESDVDNISGTWAADLDRHEHLSLVSSFYGPGGTGCWLMIVCSVMVSWTINRRTKRTDSITNDFIGALTMPAVAGGHLIYQLVNYPGSRDSMFVTMDLALTQRVAAIEASLCICQTFSVLALPLTAISMYKRHPKQFFATLTIGLFCFVLATLLAISLPMPLPDHVNLNRTPLIHGKAFAATVIVIVGLLVAAAMYVWMQVLREVRATRKPRQGLQSSTAELGTMQQFQRPDDRTHADTPLDPQTETNELSIRTTRQSDVLVRLSAAATLMILPVSLISSMGFMLDDTALGSLHSLAWRLVFFVPESDTTVGELDQVVALAGGAATLAFSCYDAYKSWT
jgi:hypothetical protein